MERTFERSVSVPERPKLPAMNLGGGSSRIAKGPDGSRGFDQDRHSGDTNAKLDPAAPPFVPQSLRSNTSESEPVSSSMTERSKSVAL